MTTTVAPCDLAAARFAAVHWHYAGVLPPGKLVRFGVWDDDRFAGAVVFARGASPYLGTALGVDQTELCELARVALRDHAAPVSQIVAAALRGLKRLNPGLRLVISFADPNHGHHGGIYQAGNWIYTGQSARVVEVFIDGRWRHWRSVFYHAARPTAPRRTVPGKFRYLYPLDAGMRRKITPLRRPYPSSTDETDYQALRA